MKEPTVCEHCNKVFASATAQREHKRHALIFDQKITLSKEQLQYLSGFLDAEGTIYHHQAKGYVPVRITFYNTHLRVLKTLRDWLKYGRISKHPNCHKTMFGRDLFGRGFIYRLAIHSSFFSRKLLAMLAPYLRVKRQHANQVFGNLRTVQEGMSWAYISGFHDGEGTVSYSKKKRVYIFNVANKYRPVLEEIRSFMRFGHIHQYGSQVSQLIWTDYKNQLEFIKQVLPYSIIKLQQLKQAQAFLSNRKWDMDKWGGHKLANVSSEDLLNLYLNKKLSVVNVGLHYNVTYGAMYWHLKKIGVQLRPRGWYGKAHRRICP